jgi:hypothetical protein
MDVNGELYAPDALCPGNNFSSHCTGGWVCPRTDPDVSEKREVFSPAANQTPNPPMAVLYKYR